MKLKAIGSEHDMPLALYDMLGPNEHEAGDGGAGSSARELAQAHGTCGDGRAWKGCYQG